MQKWKNDEKNKITTKFFALKILVLFLCLIPLFQKYFSQSANAVLGNLDIKAIAMYLGIILMVTFLWWVFNSRFKDITFIKWLEIFVMYGMCLMNVLVSGAHMSYSKFVFGFIIIVYTMDFGMIYGYVTAAVSAVTILIIDIAYYNGGGINPYLQNDIALTAMFFAMAWILGYYVKTESEHIEDMWKLANLDGLTNTYNHRCFYEIMTELFDEDKNAEKPLSFLMIDIDYFKNYNDTFGHQKGDEILVKITSIIKNTLTDKDYLCRYGGDEFAVIYCDTNKETAVNRANDLRDIVKQYNFYGEEMLPSGNLTISVGVCSRQGTDDTVRALIERADMALYKAKCFRKNRVEVYSSIFDRFTHLDAKSDESMISIKSLITIINSRDRYTYNHTERVVFYCEAYADYYNISEEDRRKLVYSAYLHDIGKINISKQTLISEGKLSDAEWEEIKRHSADGADIIRHMNNLDDVAQIVLQHHEHYDGSGYPNGLKGDEIEPLARILSVVDSFDAMTSKRPYQDKKAINDAFAEIRRCEGAQFDPIYAEKFIEVMCNI